MAVKFLSMCLEAVAVKAPVHLVSTRWLVSVPEVTVIYFISNFVQRMLRNGQILDTRTWSDI